MAAVLLTWYSQECWCSAAENMQPLQIDAHLSVRLSELLSDLRDDDARDAIVSDGKLASAAALLLDVLESWYASRSK